jgi:hypothetical protein
MSFVKISALVAKDATLLLGWHDKRLEQCIEPVAIDAPLPIE